MDTVGIRGDDERVKFSPAAMIRDREKFWERGTGNQLSHIPCPIDLLNNIF
jgi:hypothetical protein